MSRGQTVHLRMKAWKSDQAAILQSISATGSTFVLRDAATCTYRISTPLKVDIDFWGTTQTWMVVGDPDRRGRGIETLLQAIWEIKPSPRLAVKSDGMIVIFTDASVCSETGAAGWACWIKYGSDPGVKESGPLLGHWSSSCAAELEAVAKALEVAVARGIVRDGMRVMVQSDSLAALSHLRWTTGAIDSRVAGGHPVIMPKRVMACMAKSGSLEYLRGTRVRMNLTFWVRHVKGHRAHDDSRHSVNRLCDRLAKASMRARRAELTQAAL